MKFLSSLHKVRNLVVSDLRSLGNQRFPVRVQVLVMYRGGLSAVIAPASVCEAGGSGREELKK